MKRIKNTTKLPQTLLAELESLDRHGTLPRYQNRKQQRKDQRLAKKQRKNPLPLTSTPLPKHNPKPSSPPNSNRQLEKLKHRNPGFYHALEQASLVGTPEPQVDLMQRRLGIQDGLTQEFFDDGLDYLLQGVDLGFSKKEDLEEEEEGSQDGFDLDSESPEEDAEQDVELDAELDTSKTPTDRMKQKTKSNIDIYGHTLPSTYIPPQKRTKENTKLEKTLKGLLNRLTDSNLPSIVQGILSLVLEFPRGEVIETLVRLIMEYITTTTHLLPSFCATYAKLVAHLHKNGPEYSAPLIQTVVETFVSQNQGKISINCITLLSYLYNYKVVTCFLIYDILRECIRDLTETHVEIILKIITISGTYIRSDDPTALKEVILQLQPQITADTPLRTRFMMDQIMDLKNNKKSEKKESFRGVGLAVRLDDILHVHERGKWWLVGSSWKGVEPVVPTQTDYTSLARQHKMNTDLRKSVFSILCSSSSPLEARTHLIKIDKKRRTSVSVCIYLVQMERVYNPYYAHVTHLLCDTPTHWITFQYALWDVFTELREGSLEDSRRVYHLAKYTLDLLRMGMEIRLLRKIGMEDLGTPLGGYLGMVLEGLGDVEVDGEFGELCRVCKRMNASLVS
jgi:nucleolar MIF4G domain-containing protein 1